MMVNILKCEKGRTIELAHLIHEKTNGNPFFVNQFIKTLYDENYLVFNPAEGWRWDVAEIMQMQVTDNVVDLLAGKIAKLQKDTQEILKICACIGNRFDLNILAIVSNQTVDEVLTDITDAIHEGFVILSGDTYKFHHDRIQEAAYSLIADKDKSTFHYAIGKTELDRTPKENLEEKKVKK